jgi:hypothetical protein
MTPREQWFVAQIIIQCFRYVYHKADMVWDRTVAAAVRGRRLTARTLARPPPPHGMKLTTHHHMMSRLKMYGASTPQKHPDVTPRHRGYIVRVKLVSFVRVGEVVPF